MSIQMWNAWLQMANQMNVVQCQYSACVYGCEGLKAAADGGTFSFLRRLTILSSPLNAPDATNRMLVVSTATLSPRSLRELRSGTFTIVPSSNFSMP